MSDVRVREWESIWVYKKHWIKIQVFVALIAIWVSLRWVKLPRLLEWLSPSRPFSPQDLPRLQAIVYYTDRWLTIFPYNPKGSCLPRSLLLFGFAQRCGFPVKIRFGVRGLGTGLVGHAWLTLNGKPFLENTRKCEQMVETYSFPKD